MFLNSRKLWDSYRCYLPDLNNFPLTLELMVESGELLEVKCINQGTDTRLIAFIKWKGLPTFEATWEDVAGLNHRFPWFQLEYKVNLWADGNMMNHTP